MARVCTIETAGEPIEWGGQTFTLVSRSWVLELGGRRLGLGGSYCQPLRVEVAGASSLAISIRDHVMIAKIAAAAVSVVLALWRRR